MVNEPFIGTSCSRFASHTRNAYEMKKWYHHHHHFICS